MMRQVICQVIFMCLCMGGVVVEGDIPCTAILFNCRSSLYSSDWKRARSEHLAHLTSREEGTLRLLPPG